MFSHRYEKTPAERLDYVVSFSGWLPDGDAIETATVEATGGTVETTEALVEDGGLVRVWCQGGVDGEINKVVVTVFTTGGRTKQDGFILKTREL